MSSTVRAPRRLLVPALAMAAAVALTGCAAGQISQTADQVAAIDGANGAVGNLTILNAQLAQPQGEAIQAGGNGQLLMWVSNQGLESDTLTSVTTPYASDVRITGAGEIPGQTLADLATGSGTRVVVQDFTQELITGNSVPMTFTFAKAGTIDLNVPVQLPAERSTGREPIEILPPHPTPLWETGSHGEGGHSEGSGSEDHSESTGTQLNEGAGTTAAVTESSARGESGSGSTAESSFVPSGTALAATTGGSEGESGASDEGR
ncbi:copper chaperone PCu(A)C [Nakamurella flava]|uniref:Copper chaperone PCu(A)C n=1 Tax=Nakamurella flava TaxID=2576308 RepID=A0A4U6QEY3_9ACTN|nr:copper chaperone PCu(A)C [Nakamurella flava]TKV58556.1 copper chaperone PCu(A)C [Nakamurella flava]